MRMRFFLPTMALLAVLWAAQTASAQQPVSVFNPVPSYSSPRPNATPYLNLLRGGDMSANYFSGVLRDRDLTDVQTRQRVGASEYSRFDPSLDERLELEERDRQLPPTGHPAGFMIFNGYYQVPNQHSFMPYNPGLARPAR
jgi:hypothetical protein